MTETTVEALFGIKAGIVWNALNKNGPSNIFNLVKITSLSREEVFGALGWLGRENKIVLERQGRAMVISLTGAEARESASGVRRIAGSVSDEEKTNKSRKRSKKKARKIKAQASNKELIKKALEFILSELDANQEPTPTQVSKAVGMGNRQLGIALSKLDIRSQPIRRDGKSVRIYPLALKSSVWELAALDAEGLQKLMETKARAMESDKGQSPERFTVFD